jgi:diguanylate cyclase (GGDEF)-like protein/PAS domain S-box-containing protein
MSLEPEVLLVIAALGVIALALICAVAVLFRQRRVLLEANHRSNVRYRAVLDQVSDGIFLVDAATGRLIDANSAFWRTQEPGTEIDQLKVEDILIESPVSADTAAFARLTRSHPRTIKQRCKDGQLLDVEVTVSHVQIDGRTALCYIARDITARKSIELGLLRKQRRLNHLAHHDALTGLPNRLFLSSYLERALAAGSAGGGLAVMFLDLDNLKTINDSNGHIIGDEVLVEVARHLKKFVESRGIVGRLGGDEFVVVLRNVAGRDAAVSEASAILKIFTAPLRVGGRMISTSVSIGVTLCPHDAHELGSVLGNADLAMYQAKASGRGKVQFFEAGITSLQHRPHAGAPLSHRARNG